jgi:cysteine desulfurase / selenocysteine lyase
MTSATQIQEAKRLASDNAFDVYRLREDFPILRETVHGKPLVYLDNANTSQKPQVVIDSLVDYYTHYNSNIHRATHLLSEKATKAYEDSRAKVARFVNAPDAKQVVFTKGCTEGLNLVAGSYGRAFLKEGDEVVISWMEHHSNIVPWQLLCDAVGATLRVIPINEDGELLLDEYKKLLNPRTKIVSVIHVSNSMGTVNPVRQITAMAKEQGAVVIVDGAQAVPHMPVDVQEIGCDFYAFSSHKMCGPTGMGALYGRKELLQKMPPYQGGGDMIRSVTFEKTTYNQVPYKFEAGTPNIADAIAFGTAVDYLNAVGMANIAAYEQYLLDYALEAVREVPGLKLIGTAREKTSVLSFVLEGVHPHDIGTFLDREGIAVRTGQHCCQPVMDRYGIVATTRASIAFYNTKEEIDALVAGLRKVVEVFG